MGNTHRSIIRMAGDSRDSGRYRHVNLVRWVQLACDDGSGNEPWVFYQNRYTRAFLPGPLRARLLRNIIVAYGTCTGF
jgi:hypothetical protein